MRVFVLWALCLAAVTASPTALSQGRIVGGSLTTINVYPSIVAFLDQRNNFRQTCGGTILNQRFVLTAAHCFHNLATATYRIRVGSTFSNSGGVTHNLDRITIHPQWSLVTFNNDIATIRTSNTISFNNNVRTAPIAGPNYNLRDNEVLWAAGWGLFGVNTGFSEQLRHIQVRSINQNACRQRVSLLTDNMLCAGFLGVANQGQCMGDSGGPLYHHGTVVGVCSFGPVTCGDARMPAINARVSRFTAWINNNSR